MQNKLLPCPLCSEEVILLDLCKEHNFINIPRIICTSCGLELSSHSTEKLIKKWNTRKPMERIVEQLEVLHELVNDNQKLAVSQAMDIVRKGGVDNAE